MMDYIIPTLYYMGINKPGNKKFCEACGKKVECLGQPGCDYWAQYFEWSCNFEKRKSEDRTATLVWLGILLGAIFISYLLSDYSIG